MYVQYMRLLLAGKATISSIRLTPNRARMKEINPKNYLTSNSDIDGPQSVAFDQAENRMHAQKAVMALTMR